MGSQQEHGSFQIEPQHCFILPSERASHRVLARKEKPGYLLVQQPPLRLVSCPHHDLATRDVHAREAGCRPPWSKARHGQTCISRVIPFCQVRALSTAICKKHTVRRVQWTAGRLETTLYRFVVGETKVFRAMLYTADLRQGCPHGRVVRHEDVL